MKRKPEKALLVVLGPGGTCRAAGRETACRRPSPAWATVRATRRC